MLFYGQVKGFRFDNLQPTEIPPKPKSKPTQEKKQRKMGKRKITLREVETGEVMRFNTFAEAAKCVGGDPATINRAVRLGNKYVYNFKYEILEISDFY